MKYAVFSMLVLGLVGLAEFRGWSMLRYNEVQNVPKSVRDNPGAYRPIYVGSPRYYGGK
jgi:hypothetical protein